MTSTSAGPATDDDLAAEAGPDVPVDSDVDVAPDLDADLDPDPDFYPDPDRDRDRDGDAGPVLDDRSQRILAFERRWWRHAGAKEQAIRDTFGLSSTRYYQLLNALLDDPAALAHDPVLVGRLRRLRAHRVRPRRG